MKFTPRQILARLEIDGKLRTREMAEQLIAVRLAMHGDQRQVRDALKDWQKP